MIVAERGSWRFGSDGNYRGRCAKCGEAQGAIPEHLMARESVPRLLPRPNLVTIVVTKWNGRWGSRSSNVVDKTQRS